MPTIEAQQPPTPPEGLARLLGWLHRFEDGLLVFLMLCMLCLAVLQIVLRLVFHAGIAWADGFGRILVLWVGLLGAVSAARGDRHIRIDILCRYLSGRLRNGVRIFSQLAAAAVCGGTAWYGWQFIRAEADFGTVAFASVPAWICQLIIPFGFLVMTVRYLLSALIRPTAPPVIPAP